MPTDFDGRVTAFLEKTPNPVTSQINAGCYVFTRRFIDAMPPGVVLSVERDTFPGLIEAGETVMGYLESAYWLDVGTPEAYVRGSSDLVLGELASPAVPGECGQALLLPGAIADPSATITGGTAVGAGSKVGGRRGRRRLGALRRRHDRRGRQGDRERGCRRRLDRSGRGSGWRGHRRCGAGWSAATNCATACESGPACGLLTPRSDSPPMRSHLRTRA